MSRSAPDYHIPDSPEWTDIAIVGLGAAGAFAADQLMRERPSKGYGSPKRPRVIAYEAQFRVGGRLLSPQLPRAADPPNIGAMRTNETQKRVKDCSDDIGVALDAFDLSGLTAWRARGKIFHAGQNPCSAYMLPDDVQHITDPGDLIRYVTIRTLTDTDFPDLSGDEKAAALAWKAKVLEALDFKHANPQPFPKDGWRYFVSHGWLRLDEQQSSIPALAVGFSNLLVHYLGSEGFDCIRDTLGFDSVPGNWNAAAAIAWFADDFGADIVWKTPRGGFQELPKQLLKRFAESGGIVRLGYQLMRLDKRDDGAWRLLFEQHNERTGKVVREHETIAKHVILGLPPKSLQTLQVGYAGWDNAFVQHKLGSVQQQPMFKAVMVYPNAWWESQNSGLPGGGRGRVLTSSPLRQVYYFGSPSGGVTRGLPSLMVYSDCQHVDYWATFLHSADGEQDWSADRDEEIECYERYFASHGDELSPDERQQLRKIKQYIMPQRMLYKMRDLIAELHGAPQGVRKDEYMPLLGVYQGWGLDSLNVGGWHTWRIGACPEDLVDEMLQPFPNEQLYIVGEAYSQYQGWVEGALDSASSAVERLKQHLDAQQTLGSRITYWVRDALRHVV